MTKTHLVQREVAAGWRYLVMEQLSEVIVMQKLISYQWLIWGSGAQIPQGKHEIWFAKPRWSKAYCQEFSLAVTWGRRMSCGSCFCLWFGYNGFGQGYRREMFANKDFLHISPQALRKSWKESLSRCCSLHSITLPSGDKEIITFKLAGLIFHGLERGNCFPVPTAKNQWLPTEVWPNFPPCLNHSDIMDTWKHWHGVRTWWMSWLVSLHFHG